MKLPLFEVLDAWSMLSRLPKQQKSDRRKPPLDFFILPLLLDPLEVLTTTEPMKYSISTAIFHFYQPCAPLAPASDNKAGDAASTSAENSSRAYRFHLPHLSWGSHSPRPKTVALPTTHPHLCTLLDWNGKLSFFSHFSNIETWLNCRISFPKGRKEGGRWVVKLRGGGGGGRPQEFVGMKRNCNSILG